MSATDKQAYGAGETGKDLAERLASSAQDAGQEIAATAKRKVDAAADALRDGAEAAKETGKDLLEDGQSRLGKVLNKAQDTAAEAKEALVAGAGQTLSAVRDVAVEKADAARETLSDVGERLAATLNRASGDSEADALRSRMLGSIAQGLTMASDALRQRSVSELTGDVKELARRHPGAFMAAAAVAGFAAARFIRSSAERRMAERDRDYGQGPRV